MFINETPIPDAREIVSLTAAEYRTIIIKANVRMRPGDALSLRVSHDGGGDVDLTINNAHLTMKAL